MSILRDRVELMYYVFRSEFQDSRQDVGTELLPSLLLLH